MENVIYDFDPRGTNDNNLVKGERHTITVKNHYDFNYFIPTHAPFYTDDFKLYTKTQQGSISYLTEGVDYIFGLRFVGCTSSTGKVAYGSVSFINRKFTGDVYVEYRTIGGEWTISPDAINLKIGDFVYNPIETTWEQVVNPQKFFPPTEHSHLVNTLTTVDDLIKVIRKIGANNGQGMDVDLIVGFVVEKINKATIGLGNVSNLPILPFGMGDDNSDSYYVTPRATIDIIDSYFKPKLDNHRKKRDNPHEVTAEQVGTYTKEFIDSLLSNKLDIDGLSVNSHRVGDMDKHQLKAWILSGDCSNTVRFNNLSYSEMIEDLKNKLNLNVDSTTFINQTITNSLMPLEQEINNLNIELNSIREITNTLDAQTLQGYSVDDIVNSSRDGIISDGEIATNILPMGYIDRFFKTKYIDAGVGVGQLRPTFSDYRISIGYSDIDQVKISVDGRDLGWLFRYSGDLNDKNINTISGNDSFGIYAQRTDSVATTGLNYPEEDAGSLLVLPSDKGEMQIYITANSKSIYIRNGDGGGSYENWVKVNSSKEEIINEIREMFIDSGSGKIKNDLLP